MGTRYSLHYSKLPYRTRPIGGLQLTDCSVDAEVFLVERLFVADPYWKTPTPSGSTKRLGSERVLKEGEWNIQ